MNTTNVFVELLVIGIGPLVALGLLALVILGPGTVDVAPFMDVSSSLVLLLPTLAAIYILGIVLDRLADRAFKRPASRIRKKYFGTDESYHTARRVVVFHSETIWRLRQYGRSRLRICRGWSVNSLLLLVPANLYVIGAATPDRALWVVNVFLVAIFVSTVLAWRALAHSEYRKIRGAASFIREELGLEPLDVPDLAEAGPVGGGKGGA